MVVELGVRGHSLFRGTLHTVAPKAPLAAVRAHAAYPALLSFGRNLLHSAVQQFPRTFPFKGQNDR